MSVGDLFKAILSIEGGIHPALFLLVVGALIYVWLELRKSETARREEHKACSDAAALAYEKRIEEMKPVLTALERNVTALAAMTASVDSRTSAVNELVQGFASLVSTLDVRRDTYAETIARIERRQEEALNAIRSIPKGGGS